MQTATPVLTNHASERAYERLVEAGIDPAVVLARAAKLAPKVPVESAAILMARLAQQVGDTRSPLMERASNGDLVYAIVRGARVITLMLRRSTQPQTPEALHVAAVYRVRETA